jgi:hypothetical protein
MIALDGAEWVTAEEALPQLGDDITPERLRDWKRRRLVAGHRVGRLTYYRLDQLLDAELRTRLNATRPRNTAGERVCEAATV